MLSQERRSQIAGLGAASLLAAALFGATSAQAAVFPSIPDLSPYGIVSVGAHASLMINSGPIAGKVLVGDGSSVSTSGGGNGSITGGAFADTSALLTSFNGLQTIPSKTLVSSTVTADAFTEAQGLQTYLDGLSTTQTFGSLSNTTTITDTGAVSGLNVITFSSLQNAPLTISGNANDIFVLRTAGNVNTNQVMSLTGGVTANHIFWDLDGSSGNVLQTSGGDQLSGMFIDTKGGDFQFSELSLTGQLINTGGHIQFVSGSDMTTSTFTVPEPATWAMMLMGFGGLGAVLRSRRRRAAVTA
ncbi:PEPxxWA-CTERM sorting domain-containing protein [Phenylobacterium sp.]|jgi:hypothetical protein|uniref:PEPxxWA-CTERM sorting domain-containing protein n=1 Tax=Phenylobacterium sp. TaxID=1871053 RepID=UPI002E2FE800|nr:PEPxxWA-CTERM sorting domain-containing protein [Phenylobacterium sp.]HEX3364713.1 PEPxxWA-CTERM sorting domain-containing protein [Phenylobacterium sp.]